MSESSDSGFVQVWNAISKRKHYAAWLALFAVPASALVSDFDPKAYIGAFVAYLGIVTAILADLLKRTEPKESRFQSHSDANKAIIPEIQKAIRGRSCEVYWIGVTLQSAWLTLERSLNEPVRKRQLRNLKIKLLQSNPDYLCQILPSGDAMISATRTQWDLIQQFKARYEEEIKATGSAIEIAQYSYMPNLHGVLINRNTLFLSNVRWEDGAYSELSVPHEPFERLDRSTERGEYLISLYLSWLEKGFAVAGSKPPQTVVQIDTTSKEISMGVI